jgi:hypothetical protein
MTFVSQIEVGDILSLSELHFNYPLSSSYSDSSASENKSYIVIATELMNFEIVRFIVADEITGELIVTSSIKAYELLQLESWDQKDVIFVPVSSVERGDDIATTFPTSRIIDVCHLPNLTTQMVVERDEDGQRNKYTFNVDSNSYISILRSSIDHQKFVNYHKPHSSSHVFKRNFEDAIRNREKSKNRFQCVFRLGRECLGVTHYFYEGKPFCDKCIRKIAALSVFSNVPQLNAFNGAHRNSINEVKHFVL